MIALVCGYTYNGTLPGIFDDVEYITGWCDTKGIPAFVSTDDPTISSRYQKQFNLNTMFLDMEDQIRGKNVVFVFSGHGKQGKFKTTLNDIPMDIIVQGLGSRCHQVFMVLDCCEVNISNVPDNVVVVSASNSNTKSGATIVGSLFIADFLTILRSRDIRDIDELEKKLKAKHSDSQVLTSRKLLFGWVVPGTNIDYDPISQSIYIVRDGKSYQLI